MGKSTISMAIFNSYVSLPEGTAIIIALLKMENQRFFTVQRRNLTIQKTPGFHHGISWAQVMVGTPKIEMATVIKTWI
jgi:hypothetical protein